MNLLFSRHSVAPFHSIRTNYSLCALY